MKYKSKNSIVGLIFLWVLFASMVHLQAQTLILPYFCGFEDAAENSQWQFVNGTNVNQWVIGSAVSNMGASSLYISPDNGATAGHTADKGFVAVYREFNLALNTNYQISFDWKLPVYGGGRMYACWLPVTTSITAGTNDAVPNWVTFGWKPWIEDQRNALGNVIVRGDTLMSSSSSWQNASFTVTGTGVPRRLVFFFTSGSSSDTLPGACVDNVQIGKAVCSKPTDLKYTAMSGGQGVLSWTGAGASYDLLYKGKNDSVWITKDGITTNSYTIPALSIGFYVVRVRSICGNDTSIWAVFPNIGLYSSEANCVNYIDLNAANVEAAYGTFDTPDAVKGIIDKGYASAASRHTIHYDTEETDPRTLNKLRTVPEGYAGSVRLGNWSGGGEGESIIYEYVVDSTAALLLLKYAVVLQNPGHDKDLNPGFFLEILDATTNNVIDATCGKEDFVAGYNTNQWQDGIVSRGVRWKDWSTLGLDLRPYIGKTVKIKLTTRDCGFTAHFGYAYFVLDCASARIEGLSCGSNTVEVIKAPEGFAYEWYKKGNENDPDSVLTTDRSFTPAINDTLTYVCKVRYIGDKGTDCGFTLEAALAPRFIKAQFSSKVQWKNCEAEVSFDNTSYTFTRAGNIGEVETFYWDFGNGQTSEQKNPVAVYDKPGKYKVSLTAFIAGGKCDSIISDTIVIPDFGISRDTIRVGIAKGSYYEFGGRLYSSAGEHHSADSISIAGCDSITILVLSVYDKYEIHLTDTICSDESYPFKGELFTQSGIYTDSLKSVFGYDSIIILNLNVLPVLEIQLGEQPEICGDDPYFDIPYRIHSGALSGYEILFDEKAVHAGFRNITGTDEIRIDIPDKIRPDIYQANLLFYDAFCDNDSLFKLEFMVKYPSWVLEQKWNDVIVLLNSKYNGGYEFMTYQWYINGEPVTGQIGSYIYLPQLLDTTAYYSMELTRVDDSVKVFTCAIVPELRAGSDISVYPRMVSPGESIQVFLPAKGKAAVWNTMGLKMGEHTLEEFSNAIEMPDRKGVYILDIATDEGQGKTFQVIVK